MKNLSKFGAKPTTPDGKAGNPSDQLDCAAVELLWAEAVEGILPAAVAEQFHAHTVECASCREKLAQARSGREWLLLLKQEPLEPPSDIVARILARTSLADTNPAAVISGRMAPDFADHPAASDNAIRGNGDRQEPASAEAVYLPGEGVPLVSSSLPVWQRNSVVVLRRTLFEPRLALVAAMAFFSISLTLNLMGVRLTKLRAADLEPQAMRRAASRQYVEANARVVRYYENLRIVYEVESQVRQLRQAAETSSPSGQTSNKSGKQAPDSSNDESDSHRVGITANPETRGHQHAIPPDPKPVITSPLLDAAFDPQAVRPRSIHSWSQERLIDRTFFHPETMPVTLQFPCQHAPQIDSCVPHTVYLSIHRFSTRERRLA